MPAITDILGQAIHLPNPNLWDPPRGPSRTGGIGTIAALGGGLLDYFQRRSATGNAVDALRRGTEQAGQLYAPYGAAGAQGLTNLRSLSDPETAMAFLEQTPGYQTRLAEGQRQIERSAAARGNLLSGGTLKAISRYGQDYAANAFDEEFGRNLQLTNLGFDASTQQARLQQELANALAAGDFERANLLSGLIKTGVGVAGDLFGLGGGAAGEGGLLGGISLKSIGSGLGKVGAGIGKGVGAIGKGVAAGAKGLGGAVAGLASNPIGLAALAGGGLLALGKTVFGWGNTHKYADKLTAEGGAQGQFGADMTQIAASGAPREQQLAALTASLQRNAAQAVNFAGKGKDQTKVTKQWFGDFSNADWQRDWPELAAVVQPYLAQLNGGGRTFALRQVGQGSYA